MYNNSDIKILESERVTPLETQWKIEINGKEVWVAKFMDMDWLVDWEIFKGKELLTEDEQEIVVDWVNEQEIR